MKGKLRTPRLHRRDLRLAWTGLILAWISLSDAYGTIAQAPLFLGQGGTPLILLNMERDHKLYYEAYNDASDINGDGALDTRYKPAIDYYGYFNSKACYSYASGVFTPVALTLTKKCDGTKWSGDYLNYLTMSRMDALRRVLYGGYRSTDSATDTVLERSYIPQDAHSWGKEYTSTTVDGFDIAEYAPLSQPTTGYRHLFANTTPLCPVPSGYSADSACDTLAGLPLLRVLTNTSFRVWEWLSIERPVAGVQCATGNNSRSSCAVAGGSTWQIVPSSYFSGLTQTTYDINGYASQYPSNHDQYNTLVTTYAIDAKRFGSISAANINGSGNPNSSAAGSQDNYLTIFQGTLVIPTGEGGTYNFAVDGDDAVEVIIDGTLVAGWYGGHGSCGCGDHNGSISLSAGNHTLVFRQQDYQGGDNYYLRWQKTVPAAVMTDYVVRVQACVSGLAEAECRGYPANSPTVYKPSGLLQEYGGTDRMAFGLLTGSYTKNESGGVLRKNVSSLTGEISTSTGQFTSSSTKGIIQTMDALKIVGFGSSYFYNQNCGVPEVSGPLTEGRCRMWGNPTGEMMYEGLRYFAGQAQTSDFSNGVSSSGTDDSNLGLPQPTWVSPYASASTSPVGGGYPVCSKPSQLVISDINPSYDSDQVPGASFTPASGTAFSGTFSGKVPTSTGSGASKSLNVTTLGDSIWVSEYGSGSRNLFIGESLSNTPSSDGAPTAKAVTSFGNIRGLSPEEPTKQGSYYAGSVAYFGKTTDLNTSASGNQRTDTFSVALASPLPRIVIPLNGQQITLVPFGKTVGGCLPGAYTPTNTIVDFYVDTIKNTDTTNTDSTVNGGRPYGKFRINYEDSEYGSDHDMDAIAEYELVVNASGTLDITVTSNYAAGGCIQHMGYVISGTSADGIYLEIRDPDTAASNDPDYALDTPRHPTGPLPTTHTRNFSTGTNTTAAFVAHDPLWYAAKWGGFVDSNNNNQLDANEWDVSGSSTGRSDGVPDSYFLVTNASKLKEQLDKAFAEITARDSSSSSVATNSTSVGSNTLVYQAKFNSGDWSGRLLACHLSISGTFPNRAWETDSITNDANECPKDGSTVTSRIPDESSRHIYSFNPQASTSSKGIEFKWANLNDTQKSTLDNVSKTANASSSPIVSYLRGYTCQESQYGLGTYRDRPRKPNGATANCTSDVPNLLGDIVNSDPWFAGTLSFGYESLPGSEGTSYVTFRSGLVGATTATPTPTVAPTGTPTATPTPTGRRNMLYVGANDGMLHGFDANTGAERFAYVPNAVISPELVSLSVQGYTHKYLVDGSPRVADAFFSSAWHTVLVGTMGGANTTTTPKAGTTPSLPLGTGGSAVFALDVTDPDDFTTASTGASRVLWEFSSRDDGDLGYTISQATIVRLYDGNFAAIVANGYSSANGHAILYVLNIADGSILKKIDANATATTPQGSGLSTPIAVDVDGDRIADYVYAGDLKGNMWKFDLTCPSGNQGSSSCRTSWGVAYSGNPLFVARDSSGGLQPITAKPQVGKATGAGQAAGFMVYFGTGKFFEVGDNVVGTSPQIHTFYGIWDKCAKSDTSCDGHLAYTSVAPRGDVTNGTSGGLQEQRLLSEGRSGTTITGDTTQADGTSVSGTDVRVSTQCTVNYGTTAIAVPSPVPTLQPNPPCANLPNRQGWFMDLKQPPLTLPGTYTAQGERVTSSPLLRGDRVVFTTVIPSTDPCSFGGDSWLMELQAVNGGSFGSSPFDVNNNGRVDSKDNVFTSLSTSPLPASGLKSTIGIIKTPNSVISSSPTTELKCFSGSSGKMQCITESASEAAGRLSWRQMR